MTKQTSAGGGQRPDLAAKLNAEICCEDLADRLGLVRPGGSSGNFRSPHHPDKAPSVSVYQPDGGGLKRWKDWSTGEGGGPVDMLMWASGLDFPDAVKELASMYRISVPAPAGVAPQQRRVVSSHDAFGYFAAAYGLEFLAAQSWNTDSEPSAADIARLIEQAADEVLDGQHRIFAHLVR